MDPIMELEIRIKHLDQTFGSNIGIKHLDQRYESRLGSKIKIRFGSRIKLIYIISGSGLIKNSRPTIHLSFTWKVDIILPNGKLGSSQHFTHNVVRWQSNSLVRWQSEM